MAQFSDERVDGPTKERILRFLNLVNVTSDIAGTEPQEGPVHDDPQKRKGDQINDYDIELIVAQRIIDKRDGLPGGEYSGLSQLSDIKGFGQDKFDDLVYSFSSAFYGEWEHLGDASVHVVHAAVLNSGKVLMFAGKSEDNNYPLNSAVWDPESNCSEIQEAGQQGTYSHDLFCSHHSFLADGCLLVNGGDEHPNGHTLKLTYVFDPKNDNNKWVNTGDDMNQARWYPTTLTLPANEGAITFSGHKTDMTFDVGGVPEVESYDFQEWSVIPNANKALRIYPGMHLMPDGKIFYTGTRWGRDRDRWEPSNNEQTALYDLKAKNDQWSNVGHHIVRDRTEGMSVILPPDNQRVLVIGGRGDSPGNDVLSTNSVEMIDFNKSNPQWENVSPMMFKRRNVNAVLLPTGKVLVCSGIQSFKWDTPPNVVLDSEEYDSENDSWTTLAKMTVPRQYHSVSLLLPDARVLNLGGVPSDGTDSIQLDMEVFSPPYLFQGGTRPKIDNIPNEINHNQYFEIQTAQASDIESVVIVRPMASTHHTDSEQRVVPLEFDIKNNNTLYVKAPGGVYPHYVSISGYYMLFILDKRGVPSKAKMTSLNAVAAVNDIIVAWEDGQDNNGYYQIFARGLNANGIQKCTDFTVNSVVSGQQRRPAITMAPSGDFIVAWEDDKDNNGYYQIMARGFNADGSQRFSDITVNRVASSQQLKPSIAMGAEGDFVVVWEDDKDNNGYCQIMARGFNADGSQRFLDITVNTVASGQQRKPAIAMGSEGSFIVVWEYDKDKNGYYQIMAHGFNADGSQRFLDIAVNTVATGQERKPAIAMGSEGNFIVVWEDDKDKNGYYQIMARSFNSDGSQRFSDITVNTVASGQQLKPSIAMGAEGDFVVVWEDDKDENGYYQIMARGFNADGSQKFSDITVNTVASGQQLKPSIAMEAEGDFVVVWEDDKDNNGYYQIMARGFNADGSQKFSDITVNTVASGQQRRPVIAMRYAVRSILGL